MRLLSIDITKVKRLSLKEVKLPAKELKVGPITPPVEVQKPLSDEEIAYSKLVAINPLIEDLVERLNLVSIKTGDRIKIVEVKEDSNPILGPEIKEPNTDRLLKHIKRLNKRSGVVISESSIKSNGAFIGATDEEIDIVIAKLLPEKENNNSTLIKLAQKIIKGEDSYRKEDIVERIKEATKVSQDRAEIGFNLMLQAGAIEQTINPELYYLGGSTPF